MVNVLAKQIFLKQPHVRLGENRYALWAGIIIACAVVLRLGLTALGWPQTNSDESTMGLMALHIMDHVQYPIFYYGQQYMGATEAYLASVVFRVFGASVFTLRLVTTGLFAVFLVTMYHLASLLYSRKLALVTLALLALGSNIMLFSEVLAIGGYPELLACGALLFLLTARLALSERRPWYSKGWRKELLLYGCWGFVAGIGFWSDYVILLLIMLAALTLLCYCWRALLKGGILALLAGFTLGICPLIIYNWQSPPSASTFAVIWQLHNNFSNLLVQAHITGLSAYLHGALNTLLVSLPSITGAPSYCYDSNLMLYGYPTIKAFQCWQAQGQMGLVIVDGLWSAGFLVLWAIAAFFALRGIVQAGRRYFRERLPEDRRMLVVQGCRLLLLLSAAITLAQFAASPVSVAFPTNARYLAALLISLPALLAPLVERLSSNERSNDRRSSYALRGLKALALALLAAVFLFGMLGIAGEIAPSRAYASRQQALINNLEAMHIRHIYSDYWLCYRIMFVTREYIACGALNGSLQPDHNRYPLYYVIVSGDPHSTYVLLQGSSQLATFDKAHGQLIARRFDYFTFGGYEIFRPR
jgi:hypothetical protein